MDLDVPHNFDARKYQQPLFKAMEYDKYNRAILVWARRHGKDKTCFAYLLRQMLRRVGNYAYIFPTASLARKAAWQNIDADGFKLLDHIPNQLIAKKQDQQMHIELINGSTVTFFGSDRQVSVGTNYVGIVFSEFALQDPTAWNLLRPVLRQNKGWAIINSTPRGRNHFHDLWLMAQKNEEWYCSLISANDTDVFSADDIKAERDSGMSEEMIQQEFFVSFNRGIEGSYYGKLIDIARKDGRIGRVYPQDVITHAAFDLGMNDSTVIWVWQMVNNEIHFIDYYEMNGEPISHYVKWLKDKPYIWGDIWVPHDAQVRELGTGKSRIETFQNLGIDPRVVPNIGLLDGIEVVRQTLPRCWFDEYNCQKGIESLECYHREWDQKNEVYKDRPVHDKYSHAADSARYASLAITQAVQGSDVDISALNRKYATRL